VELVKLRTRSFRNLCADEVEWTKGANLVLGGNGQGKTNLLEAVAVLGTLRSFRTANLRRLARHGEGAFAVEGDLRVGAGTCNLQQVVENGPPMRRQLRLNGASVSAERYLGAFPVFAITSTDRELVVGAPSGRRSYLDRFAFLLEPSLYRFLREYRRALRQRNAALSAGAGDGELEVWEQALAASAARVVDARLAAVVCLRTAFEPLCRTLGGPGMPQVVMSYRGDPWWPPGQGPDDLATEYGRRLVEQRSRDRGFGYTVDGPHRHDLGLRVEQRPVRDTLSSGQVRVVAAALRLAALGEVESALGDTVPMIIDDVDAEVDGKVLERLVAHLGGERQLLLSSAHEEMSARIAGNRMWMSQGVCSATQCGVNA
jgi:DNA replication and repair protein RecF